MCSSVSVLCRMSLSGPCSSRMPLLAKKQILKLSQSGRCMWSPAKHCVQPQASMTFTNQNRFGSGNAAMTKNTVPGVLSKQQAKELAIRLTPEERQVLVTSLQECQSQKLKAEYEGQLAAFRWRSKFGRPSKVPSLGDVDPTGSYCTVPDDWLLRKYAETVPQPSARDLWKVFLTNAIPFVGFGFLDNFIMIIAGDSIEAILGSFIVVSTMAAAALGNTVSDILGIGTAFYIERLALRIGIKPPNLSPMQLALPRSRSYANWGRVFGVFIGCSLGMTPLLFLHKDGKEENDKEEQVEPAKVTTTATLVKNEDKK